MDSVIAVGYKSQPRLPDMQSTILLPCAEPFFNLDPPPSVAPVNLPSWIVQADPPHFMDSPEVTSEMTKDHVWLLFAGFAKQNRTVLRLTTKNMRKEPLFVKTEFEIHTKVSARLLSLFPPAVRLLASNEPSSGEFHNLQGWFDEQRDLPSSVPYAIAVMSIMVYSMWVIPMGPQTKNMLEDTAWVGSESFLPCIELANTCTKFTSALLSAAPTFPIPGTTVLFHIFQIGAIHLLCAKHALSNAPKVGIPTSSPGASGSDGVLGKGLLLSDVSQGSIGTASWTSEQALNTVAMDSLAKAEVHGHVLWIHASETKMGESVWNLWEATLKDVIPVISALGSLELTERIVELNPEEYQD
ncbi:hypothetical protein M427DRAFT_309068 [Gonapodya prolifera JEL478]|uniref:Uncharacterized protein n=1 Tax=Gonapodya prolifera (strain JEL478) TaxID=1344416 RepID=A0A139AG90_GONPJ|nr:hypothetical protein M427DRAFT_309068 [Gonapodya prolifera JEL478]|eukprot:KXS15807.1 hypothetical protein M427DRAFT_309068 [Gonapodya prolifera JEL478]